MHIAVLGATGNLGTKITNHLKQRGHEVIEISRTRGIDVVTGSGLTEALADADVIIDTLNIGTFNEKKATSFFWKTTQNVVAAAKRNNIDHIVCVSIAGASDPAVNARNGYYIGKAVQEKMYRASGLPVTIIHSTQWFELIDTLVGALTLGPITILPTMRMAPVAADSVAWFVAETAVDKPPAEGVLEVAIRGPEIATGIEMAQTILATRGEVGGRRPRIMWQVPLLGKAIASDGLIPHDAVIDDVTLNEWLHFETS